MKTDPTGNQDEALHRVLQEWRPKASLPPDFQNQVWLRIERAQASSASSAWAAIIYWIDTVLPRPALAASYVAVLLVVGATAGWTQAHEASTHIRDELGQRYVRAVDPYLAPRE